MKIIKLLTVFAILLISMTVSAQEEEESRPDDKEGNRKIVFVAKFQNNSKVSDITVNNLRQVIISGLTNTHRVVVLDHDRYSKKEIPDATEARLDVLRKLGWDYMLECTLNSINVKSGKDIYGNVKHEARVNYTISLTDVVTRRVDTSETYSENYTGDAEDEAVLEAIALADERMKKFVDMSFPIEGYVKALEDIDQKKNAVKSCYVSLGKADGIIAGDILEVFANIEVTGEHARKKVGELKAVEVMSNTLTFAKEKNGGNTIKKYFDEGVKLTVVSRPKKKVTDHVANTFKKIF